jgi:methylase of polypeptide subunit release factors
MQIAEIERASENIFYGGINPNEIDVFNLPYLFSDMIERIIENIPDIKGRSVLDLGAGTGILSIILALRGAKVTAIDISDKACAIIKSLSKKYNVDENVHVVRGTLDDIKDIERQDYVVCLNSLHHMMDGDTLDGIIGLLRGGGRAIFIEPLIYNPFGYVYRKLFNNAGRTEHETPLRLRDVIYIKSKLKNVKIKGLYLLSSVLLAFERLFKTSERSAPAKMAFRIFNFIDNTIQILPGLKYFAWKILIIGGK